MKRKVRALNFELETAFENVTPSGIGLHVWMHCQSSNSQSHLGWHFLMLFQSSKLKARRSLFTETWQKRPSSFELWVFENVTPSGIDSTIMIFIFTILLIQTYIQINYYYDINHANSTCITQYVEIALNNRSTVLCVVLLFCTGLEWFWVVVRLSSNLCTARGDWALHPEDLSQTTVHPTE